MWVQRGLCIHRISRKTMFNLLMTHQLQDTRNSKQSVAWWLFRKKLRGCTHTAIFRTLLFPGFPVHLCCSRIQVSVGNNYHMWPWWKWFSDFLSTAGDTSESSTFPDAFSVWPCDPCVPLGCWPRELEDVLRSGEGYSPDFLRISLCSPTAKIHWPIIIILENWEVLELV